MQTDNPILSGIPLFNRLKSDFNKSKPISYDLSDIPQLNPIYSIVYD